MPPISRDALRNNRTYIRVFLLIVVGLVIAFSLWKKNDEKASAPVYMPAEDKGFVGKTNDLLRRMLELADKNADPKVLSELNDMYPGLTFALPPEERDSAVMYSARLTDLRLVEICPDNIPDEKFRMFYYNSDLPRLLQDQARDLGRRVFRIRTSRDGNDRLRIDAIVISADQFRVPLDKDPWKGVIVANDTHGLFSPDNHCFLVMGKNTVPLREVAQGEKYGDSNVTFSTKTQTLTTPFSPYRYFQELKMGKTELVVHIDNGFDVVKFRYLNENTLRVKPEAGLTVALTSRSGGFKVVPPLSASASGEDYRLAEDEDLHLSILRGKEKIAEMVASRHNPLLTLSSLVRSNTGRSRLSVPAACLDLSTEQIVGGLNAALSTSTGVDSVRLTLDPYLSLEMETRLREYAKSLLAKPFYHSNDQLELSLTVMDMQSGNILCAPFYRTDDERQPRDIVMGRKNPAFLRRYIGSTFKPLLALAAVETEPWLIYLDTKNKKQYSLQTTNDKAGKLSATARFYGGTCSAWAKGTSHWNGCPDMATFIARSDDVYPVALAFVALKGTKSHDSFSGSDVFDTHNGWIRFKDPLDPTTTHITSTPFIRNLDALYGLNSFHDENSDTLENMDYYLWRHLGADAFGLDAITPDPTTMHYESFFRGSRLLRTVFVPWVLGQGTNEWNTVKLCEAWTRMITRREVKATLVRSDTAEVFPSLLDKLSGENKDKTWNSFLIQLLDAQKKSPNLLTPMYDRVKKIDSNLLLYAKTGTPDEYERVEFPTIDGGNKWLDVGLYCMALRKGTNGPGLMCVVRITRITHQKPPKKENGIKSLHARDFFSEDNLRCLVDMTGL